MSAVEDARLQEIEAQLADLAKPESVRQQEYASRTANWRDVIAEKQLRRRVESIRRENALTAIREARREKLSLEKVAHERNVAQVEKELADLRESHEAAEREVLNRRRVLEDGLREIEAKINAEPSGELMAEALSHEPSVEQLLKPERPVPNPARVKRERAWNRIRGVI